MNTGAAGDTRRPVPVIAITFFSFVACNPAPAPAPSADVVVVYAPGAAERLQPVFEAYSAESGVKLELLDSIAGGIADGFRRPQRAPEPDLFIGIDLASLWAAGEANMLRPTRSEIIAGRIPARLRDPENFWVALSARIRTPVYNPSVTNEADLAAVDGYASLAGESWRGRLCLSSSAVGGNRSLVAKLIADSGSNDAERIVRGWRRNLAAAVFADDRRLLEAIAQGSCALGIAASNQIARFKDQNPNASIAPYRFDGAGLHVDTSGGGVARHARNPDGARSLLEWLTSDTANAMFAAALLDYPANPDATAHEAIAAWAGPGANSAAVAALGFLLEDAINLAERARYP